MRMNARARRVAVACMGIALALVVSTPSAAAAPARNGTAIAQVARAVAWLSAGVSLARRSSREHAALPQ